MRNGEVALSTAHICYIPSGEGWLHLSIIYSYDVEFYVKRIRCGVIVMNDEVGNVILSEGMTYLLGLIHVLRRRCGTSHVQH